MAHHQRYATRPVSPNRPATQWVDPYLKQIVLLFLQKADSEEEWDNFCDIVKEMYADTYPQWWGQEVLFSGLLKEMSQKWQKGKKKPKWNNLFNEEDNV